MCKRCLFELNGRLFCYLLLIPSHSDAFKFIFLQAIKLYINCCMDVFMFEAIWLGNFRLVVKKPAGFYFFAINR